jgi:hypothetical protein
VCGGSFNGETLTDCWDLYINFGDTSFEGWNGGGVFSAGRAQAASSSSGVENFIVSGGNSEEAAGKTTCYIKILLASRYEK